MTSRKGDTYHAWRSLAAVEQSPPLKGGRGMLYENTPGFCHSATLAEVQKQDYKLTPGIYVGTEAEEDDGIPFDEKMEGLKATLMAQFEKSNELQNRIKINLGKL